MNPSAILAAATDPATPGLVQEPFTWPTIPFPATVGALAVILVACAILAVSKYCDITGGLLTISVMIVAAFIVATFASMLYNVPQVPSTEILIGALATSVGAIVAYWMSKSSGKQ